MNTRIRKIRKVLGLTQRDFAEKIGLKHNAVSIMEKPDSKITDQNILSICARYHVNEAWLRTGEGEMFVTPDPLHEQLLSLFDKLTPPFQNHLLSQASALLTLQTSLSDISED